jgi:glutamate synthase (NADPH/NADH) small chain
MAKPTGFMEYDCQLSPDRPVKERIQDWEEFHTSLLLTSTDSERQVHDCGTAFCQMGS